MYIFFFLFRSFRFRSCDYLSCARTHITFHVHYNIISFWRHGSLKTSSPQRSSTRNYNLSYCTGRTQQLHISCKWCTAYIRVQYYLSLSVFAAYLNNDSVARSSLSSCAPSTDDRRATLFQPLISRVKRDRRRDGKPSSSTINTQV